MPTDVVFHGPTISPAAQGGGGRHRRGHGGAVTTNPDTTAVENSTRLGAGSGPGPRRRPERPERAVWVAAAVISAGLLLLPGGSAINTITGTADPGGSASAAAATTAPGQVTPPTSPAPPAGSAGTASPASPDPTVVPAAQTTALPDQRAKIAVEVAMKQIGLPYVWGGNGPENGHRGFDCSGLTTFAYDKAGVDLPRTAHTQFRHGPRVPAGAPLQPGDLVFYGTYAKVHHVGMYIGSGRMVNAPTFGKPVQTAWYRYSGDDYIGATRPAGTGTGALPAPDPAVPERPDPAIPDAPEFRAPAAPPLPAAPDPRAPQPPEAQTAKVSIAAAGPAPVRTPAPAIRPSTPVGGPVAAEGSPDRPKPQVPPTTTSPVPSPPATTVPRPTPRPTTPKPTPAKPSTTPTTNSPTTPSEPPPPATPRPTPPPASEGERNPAVRAVALVDTGTARALIGVRRGSDGLPAAPGVVAGPGRWTVRLASPLATVNPGTLLVLRLSDGNSQTVTIRSSRTVTGATAATSTAKLAVVTPAGPGRWILTTAN